MLPTLETMPSVRLSTPPLIAPFTKPWPDQLSVHALCDIALGLARTASNWVPRLDVHPTARTGLRLLATPEYDAWLLRWPAGTNVTPHDHGPSAGAFTVVTGELTERRWRAALRHDRQVGVGQLVTVPTGIVHDVLSMGPELAISVHAYSPPLTSMGFYDDDARRLLDRLSVDDAPEAAATTRVLHPARGA